MDLTRPQIDQVGNEWRAWIPPRGPQDYEGDAIMAPYGDTFWATEDEAKAFIEKVANS